jgi:hypothetical protein
MWNNIYVWILCGGTRWLCRKKHLATSWKAAGSNPYAVIGVFHWQNPSGRTMALGSTNPLTEMSTRNIFWGWGGVKAVRCIRLTNLPPSCAECKDALSTSTSWNLQGLSRPVQACPGIAVPLHFRTLLLTLYKLLFSSVWLGRISYLNI